MKIGVISDTHGMLRAEALEALAGCELIVHAGDIGKPDVIQALAALAPLRVVRGNNDFQLPWAAGIADQLQFDLAGRRALLLHDIADVPADLDDAVQVVITGHSHKPLIDWRGERLYLNPGSAGPRRFKLPVTVAIIDAHGTQLQAQIVPLLG